MPYHSGGILRKRMFDGRCVLLLTVSLCLAACGCQNETPASATGLSNGKSPPAAQPTAPGPGERTKSGVTPAQGGGTAAESKAKDGIRSSGAASKDGRTIPITFDDLELRMKEDSVFEPSLLTPRVKQLDGRRVRIRGFIFPGVFQLTGITRFPLVKNTQCKFGPGGLAHHVIMVDLQPGSSVSFTVRPIAVEGRLTVRPFAGPDGMTWTVYHLAGDRVN